jgi:hypothetical protein
MSVPAAPLASSPFPAIARGTPAQKLILASGAYLILASIATAVAIATDRPAEFSGMTSGLPAWKDFIYGFGTALSPTLWWMVIQVVFTVLVSRPGRAGSVGIIGLGTFGVLEFIGALGEPITFVVFTPGGFQPALAAIQLGMIAIPLAMAVLAFRAWRRRPA